MEKIFLTWSEACEVLGIGRSRLYDLARRGEIASVKLGRSRRFPVESIREWADKQIRESQGQGAA